MAPKQLSAEDLIAALPDLNESLQFDGLNGSVEIWRDRWGIPHVRATTTQDAFFGQGFAHAQDRLWQMDADRRKAHGRWAAVVGPSGLDQDRQMRCFRLAASVQVDLAHAVDDETRAMLDAYAAGVNAWIDHATRTNRLPIEHQLIGERPDHWTAADSLLVFKVRHINMGEWASKIWRGKLVNQVGPTIALKLIARYPRGAPVIIPPGAVFSGELTGGLAELEAGVRYTSLVPALGGRVAPAEHVNLGDESEHAGSNNWVVAGSRTVTGKPIVAGDPHRAPDVPNVYYQNHVACQEFDVVGFSFAGVPGFPHFAHNDRVAWAITHGMADYQDAYIEHFDPANPIRYRNGNEWRTAERYRERIDVRGGDPVELDVTVTHHGPILVGEPEDGYAIAIKYTATAAPFTGLNAILPMMRARTAADLDEAMRCWVDPVNNLIFADVNGNIGYRTRGQIPVRPALNAWLPVPGWTGEYEWQGNIPFEEMPATRNPSAGFVVTANNRIQDRQHPYHTDLAYGSGSRAQRIVDRLQAATPLGANDMPSIHADRVSLSGRVFRRLIEYVEPADEWQTWARDLLMSWDGEMRADSAAPLVYAALRERLTYNLLAPILGSIAGEALQGTGRGGPNATARLRSLLASVIAADDRLLLPAGATWPPLMQTSLAEALKELRTRLGDDRATWRWDRLHRVVPIHPLTAAFPACADLLNPPSVGVGGDSDTVQAAGSAPGLDFTVTGTSVARYVFDLADWEQSRWHVPLGASGHPGSPHYADQAADWAVVRLIPMLYDWSTIAATAEAHQTLRPDHD